MTCWTSLTVFTDEWQSQEICFFFFASITNLIQTRNFVQNFFASLSIDDQLNELWARANEDGVKRANKHWCRLSRCKLYEIDWYHHTETTKICFWFSLLNMTTDRMCSWSICQPETVDDIPLLTFSFLSFTAVSNSVYPTCCCALLFAVVCIWLKRCSTTSWFSLSNANTHSLSLSSIPLTLYVYFNCVRVSAHGLFSAATAANTGYVLLQE